MKLIWLLMFFMIASCKAISTNALDEPYSRTGHLIEITFLNSESNYSAIVSAVQKNALSIELQYYPVNTVYPSLTVVSVRCPDVSETTLSRLKAAIGCCSGVIAIHDTE